MTTLTTYILDFEDAETGEQETGEVPYFVVRTCPSVIGINQPFRIIIQGPGTLSVRWPYTQTLVAMTPTHDEYVENIDIGGAATVEPFAPIADLLSVAAINDMAALAAESDPAVGPVPYVRHAAGLTVPAGAPDGRLRLREPVWGTLRIRYRSNRKTWDCAGLPNPGEYAFQVVHVAPILLDGIETGQKAITAMHTIHVQGLPEESGLQDFCGDLGE